MVVMLLLSLLYNLYFQEEFNKFTVKLLTPSQEFMLAGSDTSPDIRVKNSRLIDYESGITVYRLQVSKIGNQLAKLD